MKKLFYWISAVLVLAFWPLSFFLANRDSWMPFFLVLIILLVDLVLYLKQVDYHYFLYLLLPLIHPAFLAFPFFAFLLIVMPIKKVPSWTILAPIIYTVLLVFVSLFTYKTFYAYSIFTPDPLAFDTLNKKISLIPNRNLARIYENKTTIFQDKMKSNIFISLDPNNYFFSLHPQEIGGNQNLSKFPYLAIIIFLIGVYFLPENKHKYWIISLFITAAISIAFINNQDRFDLILYLPVSIICLSGLKKILDTSSTYSWIFMTVFIPISIIELIRILVIK